MLFNYDTLDLPNSAALDPEDPNYGKVPIATTEQAGIVKPDGTSITVEEDGTIHSEEVDVIYNNSNPSIAVGGIAEGTTFEDQTMQDMFDSLLYPELFPTLTAPSMTLTKSPNTTYYEIGQSISLSLTATFNRGSINPAYNTSGFRSGLPNKYTWAGAQIAKEVESTDLSNNQTLSSYIVLQGNNTWNCTVAYDAGEQPKSNKGNNYDSPLPAGTLNKSVSIVGVYPYYATTTSINTMTKQALTAMNSTYVEVSFVAETDNDKQKIAFPQDWSTIRGVQFYNTLNNTWAWMNGSKANSLTSFDISSTTFEVQGNTINYTQYTFNGPKTGARSLRFYTV